MNNNIVNINTILNVNNINSSFINSLADISLKNDDLPIIQINKSTYIY